LLLVPARASAQDVTRWLLEGDARVRGDFVRDLPGGRDDLERARLTARPWLRFVASPSFEIAVGPRLSLGTDHNDDNDINFDNEQTDAIELDRMELSWLPIDGLALRGGRMPLRLDLSPLVWDEDLRPVGLALGGRAPIGFDVLEVGAILGVVPYLGDLDERVAMVAGQLGYRWREGAESGIDVLGAAMFMEGDNWEQLAAGMIRQNRPGTPSPSATYRDDFLLLDVQVGLRAGVAGVPMRVHLEGVRNPRALDGEDAAERVGVTVGHPRRLSGGWNWQRVERDAVMGALNSDDWWFHSRAHGHSLWIEAGVLPRTTLRASGFRERREDLGFHTTRALLELTTRLGPE
jgi:hypothetical protein